MPQKRRGKDGSAWGRAFGLVSQFLVPGLVLLLGLYLTGDPTKWWTALLVVGTSLIASGVAALLIGGRYLATIEDLVADLEGSISNMAYVASIHADGRAGVTQEQMSKIESSHDLETVWIVGENFDNEVNSAAPFLSVVRHNIQVREMRYAYVAPKRQKLTRQFKRLQSELGVPDGDSRLTILLLPDDKWQKMPYKAGNFTIYDAVRTGHTPTGYCWDPGGDGRSFIELRRDVAAEWVGDIQEICPQLDFKPQGTPDAKH